MAGYQSAEEARKVLQKLIDLAKEDQSIKEGAAGTELTVSFELMDLDLVFNLSFIDGQVDGFIGEPEEEPMVTLSMDSEVTDSIFSGRWMPSAAMSGDLSLAAMWQRHGLANSDERLRQALQESPFSLNRLVPGVNFVNLIEYSDICAWARNLDNFVSLTEAFLRPPFILVPGTSTLSTW